ncbi:hypothetical protein ACNKHP_05090 [Shigella boydii]
MEAGAQGYQLHLLDVTNTLATIVNQIIADEQLERLVLRPAGELGNRDPRKSQLNAKLVSATPDALRQIKTPEEGV